MSKVLPSCSMPFAAWRFSSALGQPHGWGPHEGLSLLNPVRHSGIVVKTNDLTGIVVGVTLFETRVVCRDRVRD